MVLNGTDLINGIPMTEGDKNVTKIIKKTKNGGVEREVNPAAKYFFRLAEDGSYYVTPVNDNTIRAYSQGLIGKVVEAGTSKAKTSNLWSEDETEVSDTPINTKKTNAQSGSGSATNVSRNTQKVKVTW